MYLKGVASPKTTQNHDDQAGVREKRQVNRTTLWGCSYRCHRGFPQAVADGTIGNSSLQPQSEW